MAIANQSSCDVFNSISASSTNTPNTYYMKYVFWHSDFFSMFFIKIEIDRHSLHKNIKLFYRYFKIAIKKISTHLFIVLYLRYINFLITFQFLRFIRASMRFCLFPEFLFYFCFKSIWCSIIKIGKSENGSSFIILK